ncbi:hypothetical protein BKA61DRAFT_677120 [Leptodontidium sp. MPI-SDFR-AT-0119]|nr:hypothetical protein BKA61DRAFT_677120 [Leptodontidium sp. MPI-SDFR-AT-0119]
MEALGAAAAAFQLVQKGAQIVEILSKIHDAPTWGQGQANSLRTALLQSLLNGCLKDATRLNNLLIGLSAKEEDGKIIRYWKSIVTEILNGIDTGIVALGDSLAAVVDELPAVRQTAQDVTTLITEILQLRDLTTGLRLELSSISEKVSTLRDSASTSSGLDKSEASGLLQTSAVHTSLPALLHALEHLSMQDDKDESIKNSSIANSEVVMKHGQCVITVDDLYTKDEARLCLASLSPTDQKILRNRLSTKYDLACQWFLALPEFYTWENGDYSDLLYITANAGCGKTTIAAHVLDALEKSATAVDKETYRLLYFFFQKSNVEGEGTAATALRTIINQLVYQMPSLYYSIRRQYDILATRGTVVWSWDSLSIVFVDMMSQIKDRSASKTYLVLDGLDECSSDTRRDLVVFLRSILEENTTQASSRQVSAFKVFITGRPDNDIFDIIPPSKHTQITNSQTTRDISTLIETRVAELGLRRRLGPDVQIAIKHFLETNAWGMFLWVVLVLQGLERRDERLTDAAIAARLSAIPRTLTATYEGIISSTPLARRDDLWRILRIMLVSRRTMTITELEAALCTELGISNWHDFAGDVNALCSSLITFEGDKVLFVHQSVRDFSPSFRFTWIDRPAWWHQLQSPSR